MLTAADRARFEETGIIRIPGVFSPSEALAMQRLIWDELARVHGIRHDDASSWRVQHAYGLQRISGSPAFAPIDGQRLREAIDQLLGAGSWDVPKRWGPILVTLPATERSWAVPPALWHADFPFSVPSLPLAGVKVFTFVSRVPPHGGGTLVVAGSHRLVERFVTERPAHTLDETRRTRLAFLGSHPWLRELTARGRGDDGIARFVDREELSGGVSLRVAELTGEAGDIVLTHPWVLHCRGMNCAAQPRFMRAQDIYRRSVAVALGMAPTSRQAASSRRS